VQQRCTGEPIHLDPQGAFHARLCCGRQADLDDGHLVLDGTHYSLDALSFENDAIHGFVRKFLGGRWPKPGHTVLRVAATSGERQALRFRRFQNRFWAEPVVELDYDMAELDDESVVLPLGSITSAVAVNPWRADSERRFFGHDLGDAAGKLWVLQLRGGSPSVVRFVDVEDDLVELVLRFVDPYSEQRSAATASSIQLFAGPITLTPPASSAYSYRCSPLAAERVVKLSRTATTTEHRVRILGFQGADSERKKCCSTLFNSISTRVQLELLHDAPPTPMSGPDSAPQGPGDAREASASQMGSLPQLSLMSGAI